MAGAHSATVVIILLVGRHTELALVEHLLEADPASPVLVLSGEPGVGKSVLLDAAAEVGESAGWAVVRATALQYEADLPFWSLNQMLHPLLDILPELEELHRTAIAVICGLQAGPPPTQLIAGAATLALVRQFAQTRPLLIVIDDVPWLDFASAMAFTYLARRLDDDDVRLIVAARSELENVFVRSGYDAHIVEPLSDGDADLLLVSRFPALAPNVRQRIHSAARGNPLALLDLPAAFDTTAAPIPDALPLSNRLTSVYSDRLRDLPARTREMLLFVVLAGAESSLTIDRCMATPEGRLDLPPAEKAGILRRNPRSGRMEFRHPLIRSAVVELSTREERQRAHEALAQAFIDDPNRRAWHLGQSTTSPDEHIAAMLETASDDLLHTGNSTRATAAMLRAAELSPSPRDRARRVARAAYLGSLVTGALHAGSALVAAAQAETESPPSLDAVIAAAYQLLSGEGDASTAQRLLVAALDALPDPLDSADEAVVEALHTLVFVGFYAARPAFSLETRRQLSRLATPLPDTLTLLDRAFTDPARIEGGEIRQLESALDDLRFTADPVRITRIATAGAYLDRIAQARDPLARVIDDGQRGGAVAKEIEALFLLANDAYFTGEWDDLESLTDDGLRLSIERGYALTAAPGRFLRGLVDASRGRRQAADAAAEQLLLWAAPRRLYTLAAYASHIRCILALSEGNFEIAYRHAASISPAGTLQPFLPHAVWLVFDLVEASARAGRSREAAAHVQAADEAGLADHSSRLHLLVTAARGLTNPKRWRDEFDRSLGTPDSQRWVFDRARVQLVYGEQLRREHAANDARVQLSAAADAFRRLQALPWLDRAHRELRAAGGSEPRTETLTAQESAIAELAATGLSNKEIATRLFLSPRTVSTHLSHVYPKLGITSRGALRDALDRPTAQLRQ
ncbi:helix-turn-helix transcriptional regulator [Microbacterium sp. 2FI]|uniref:helix-turn-helix transcriptional regulator n=1 Tax=Microbacterium sp. 2FI TaxID=2502193 RepID=UPI0010FA224F|nr:helix-turn-helix transcriptional regulator [Microbacterium sp. 2FI]